MMKLLSTEAIETMARWGNSLNNWKWPSDMPGEPAGWRDLPDFFKRDDERNGRELCKADLIAPLHELLEFVVGKKEMFRWHHLNNLQRTPEEFAEWWGKRDEPLALGEAITKGWTRREKTAVHDQ